MFVYDKYRYIGNHGLDEDKEKYRFNQEKANQLLANKQYLELADYLSQYQFIDSSGNFDVEKNNDQNNRIIQLRDAGRKAQAYYQHIPEGDENVVNFANSVFTPGGLKQLRTQTVNDASGNPVLKYKTDKEFAEANPEAAAYIRHLDELGSSIDRTATGLKLVFSDKKYGFFGIDALKKDYNQFYDVLSKSGMTEKEIEALGGKIIRKNGEISVEFDKNAGCCTRLINALTFESRTANNVKIIGLDKDGEIQSVYGDPGYGIGYIQTPQEYSQSLVKLMQESVSYAQRKQEAVEIKQNLDTKQYSSQVFEIRTDRSDVLEEQYNNGQISWQEYNALRKEEKGINVRNHLAALTYGPYEIYSDYFNEDNENSEIKNLVQSEQWDELRNIIKAAPPSKVHYMGEVAGGRVGLHITIDPDALYEHKGKKGAAVYTGKPIQIFIPGFLTEEIEAQMNNDTGLRAVKEWNNMIDYGYNYQKQDGTQIGVDKNGNVFRYVDNDVFIDNSLNAKDKAIREINEDLIKEEASRLKYVYMNNKGEINVDRYDLAVKQYCLKAVNELYDGIPLEDFEGNPLLESYDADGLNKLFSDDLVRRVYLQPEDFQYEVLQKLKALYDLQTYMRYDLIRNNSVYSKQ